MKLTFQATDSEAQAVQSFYKQWSRNLFVIQREQENVQGKLKPVTKEWFWENLICALLTTQQRSGPNTPVTRFMNIEPFPLNLTDCMAVKNREKLIASRIKEFGGIRRGPTIAQEASKNLKWLEEKGWSLLLTRLKTLGPLATYLQEREVARFLAQNLTGIGPKQSRNLLQMMGLTRYEIPLDSRVTKWLNERQFPVVLNASNLSDEHFYSFVLDGFRALCEKAKLFPCQMDAAIFVSFDTEPYEAATMPR